MCDNPWPALMLVLLLAGCVLPRQAEETSASPTNHSCERVASAHERLIADRQARSAYGMPLDGAPWLRVMRGWDRWPVHDASARHQWLRAAATLGEQAWTAELLNAGDDAAVAALRDDMARCAEQLPDGPISDGDWAAWRDRARVDSDYVAWQRGLGVYPLSRLGLQAGVHAWQRSYLETFGDEVSQRDWPLFAPIEPGDEWVSTLLEQVPELPGLARPGVAALKRWLRVHAPRFRVESASPSDHPGRPVWTAGRLAFDVSDPVVHVQLLPWLDRDEPVWQLVFTLWFAGRPAESALDPYAGALDGIVWRVTLDAQGRVRMRDSIHPCGCYHVLFPTDARVPATGPAEPAIVPRRLSTQGPVEVVVRAHDHLIVDVREAHPSPVDGVYRLERYTDLLAMPTPAGAHRALFDQDGLVARSRRPERWYLWPSGVQSPGAMRVWGRHATAFVGMRHFDDVNLFDELLVDQHHQ